MKGNRLYIQGIERKQTDNKSQKLVKKMYTPLDANQRVIRKVEGSSEVTLDFGSDTPSPITYNPIWPAFFMASS